MYATSEKMHSMPDPLAQYDAKIATRDDVKNAYAEGVHGAASLFQETVKRLTEARDACQIENGRLALANQELNVALD